MAYLEAELDLSRSEAASRLRGLAALGGELEELRITARGQATRIRLSALREAAEVSARIRALAGAPEGAAESMLGALEDAIERLGTGGAEPERADAGPTEAVRASAVPVFEEAPAPGGGVGSELAELEAALEPAPDPAETDPAGAVAAGPTRISVDIGPFSDFSQLVSFEDAANAIGATGEISIRRFSEGRASIDVSLREPIDLLAELEANCELRFRVRSRAEDEIVLDLGE